MTREEVEQEMNELAGNYVETHNHEVIKQLYTLSLELEKLDKQSD
jgi:hypothetical protein